MDLSNRVYWIGIDDRMVGCDCRSDAPRARDRPTACQIRHPAESRSVAVVRDDADDSVTEELMVQRYVFANGKASAYHTERCSRA